MSTCAPNNTGVPVFPKGSPPATIQVPVALSGGTVNYTAQPMGSSPLTGAGQGLTFFFKTTSSQLQASLFLLPPSTQNPASAIGSYLAGASVPDVIRVNIGDISSLPAYGSVKSVSWGGEGALAQSCASLLQNGNGWVILTSSQQPVLLAAYDTNIAPFPSTFVQLFVNLSDSLDLTCRLSM